MASRRSQVRSQLDEIESVVRPEVAMLPRAMAHMGTHIADVRGGVSLAGVDEAESRAWKVNVGE